MKGRNTIRNILWGTILGCVFFRPFIFEKTLYIPNLKLEGILFLASLIYILNARPKISYNSLDKIIFLFFLTVTASVLSSPHKNLNAALQYTSLFLLYYITRISERQEKNALLLTIIISAICISLYSLYGLLYLSRYTLEYMHQHNINYLFAEEFLGRRRAFYPFISPNLLAGYLIMVIMICVGMFFDKLKTKNLHFYISLICISISLVVLFLTKSVGGWTVFIICLFLFMLKSGFLNKKMWFLFVFLIIMLGVIIAIRARSPQYFTKPSFSVEKRLTYWKETANIIRSHPFLGVGIGNFHLKESRTAHNSYLQIWAETGILGIVWWLWIVAIFIKRGIKNIFSRKEKYFYAGIFAGGVSFLLHNLIDFSFFVGQVAFLWWIILGLTTHKDMLD